MISTTTHLTTDIMAMPLLWVLPLAVYLVSFIIVFSAAGPRATRFALFAAPFALLAFGPATLLLHGLAATILGLLGLILLFVVATALHGTLAGDRPAAAQLTGFYIWMALGGMVGGLFAGLIAPLLFDWVYEHPILLLAAALLVPARPLAPWVAALWRGNRWHARALRILTPALVLALGWWLGAAFNPLDPAPQHVAALVLMAGLALLAIGRPLIFSWILLHLMLGLGGWQQIDVSTIERARQRSFFGIYTIENVQSTNTRRLLHGTTLHGAQSLDPARSRQPLTYYAPLSGVGKAMQAVPDLFGEDARIAVVGLGTGSLACYATPLQDWTFFEIDPLMVDLATDPRAFSFVSQCKPDARIVVGDARLKLAEEPAGRFDLLVVDAFSSDAIPLHLLTREAFETYRRSLAPGGVLVLHISNRFLDLEPVVSAIARSMELAARRRAWDPDANDRAMGYNGSVWVALAADEAAMTRFTEATGNSGYWLPLANRRGLEPWTDGFASVLPTLKWPGGGG
jgi:SAM-dependent methyltransferase